MAVVRNYAEEIRDAVNRLNTLIGEAKQEGIRVDMEINELRSVGEAWGRPIISVSLYKEL